MPVPGSAVAPTRARRVGGADVGAVGVARRFGLGPAPRELELDLRFVAEDGDTVEVRHVQVEQDDVGLCGGVLLDGSPGVGDAAEATDDGSLRVVVADTGIGIAAQDLGRLFVPFERLGAERTDVEGAGVGLALSLRLAEAMQGTITVESTEGQGSRFSVILPVADNPVEQYDRLTRRGDGNVAAPATHAPEHVVLYIEDNVSNIRLVERMLERRPGVKVIAAMQGSLGVSLAREHRPDVVLLDLHLPDMAGIDVLRALRDDPNTVDMPVVVVSADATAGQIERLLAVGATAYLTKPLDVAQFRAVLDEVLGGVPQVDA